MSQLLKADNDPDTLRLIIETYIDRVEMREDGSFAVYCIVRGGLLRFFCSV